MNWAAWSLFARALADGSGERLAREMALVGERVGQCKWRRV